MFGLILDKHGHMVSAEDDERKADDRIFVLKKEEPTWGRWAESGKRC